MPISRPFVRFVASAAALAAAVVLAAATCEEAEDEMERPRDAPADAETAPNRRKAMECKELGNAAYQRGELAAAVRHYDEGVVNNPYEPALYTNRALCNMKLANWNLVIKDAREAVTLDDSNYKGYYYLGVGLSEIGQLEEALVKLHKAKMFVNTEKIVSEIDKVILCVKYTKWKKEAAARGDSRIVLQTKIGSWAQKAGASKEELQEVADLFDQLHKGDEPFKVPSCLLCPLTMCLFRKPVSSPSGHTYDYDLIVNHINHNGPHDPFTRERCDIASLRPNLVVKEMVDDFIARHPWAAAELP